MKIKLFLLLLLGVSGLQQKVFNRKEYYQVLKTARLEAIDEELGVVARVEGSDREAYEGTLLMRKAGLLKLPKDRLEAFKRGRRQLETAIRADSGKVEYRFLRLIIQEHAPKVVKYRDKLEADGNMIRQHFSKLPADLQESIKDYSQGSAVLHPADL